MNLYYKNMFQKKSHLLQFQILEGSSKVHLPTPTSTSLPPPKVNHCSRIMGCNSKQHREKILQLRIPYPNVPPKSCASTISNTDTSSKKEILPTLSNVFPKVHPKRIPHLSSGPTPFLLPKFSNNDFPPKTLPF